MPNSLWVSRRRFMKLLAGAVALVLPSSCRETRPPGGEALPAPTVTAAVPPPTASEDRPTMPPVAPTPGAKTRVTLPNTEVFDYPSSIVGRDFRIHMAFPATYAESGAAYPLLFAGDANGWFGTVVETARGLASTGEVPDLVIVGIGYPVDSPDAPADLRVRDFSPTYFNPGAEIPGEPSFPSSGGAAKFLRFLREELVPRIEADYRVIPGDSAFVGHSLGGLFGLFALFTFPDTFRRYILGSPSIWWDDRVILRFEDVYAGEHTDLPARVFLAVGALEGTSSVAHVLDLAAVLETRGYPNLALETHVFEDETHVSVFPGTLSRGLRSVFAAEAAP